MKKIHKGWKKYLTESMKSDIAQSRIKVGKKMSNYLFSPLQMVEPRLHMSLKASGNVPAKYMFLWWAIFGTKEERASGMNVYRPKVGLEYAHQKVEMLMLKLTEDEETVLAADIDEMIDIVKKLTKNNYNKYMKESRDARAVADERWLELDKNIDMYAELYKLPYKSPERKCINSLAANQ